MLSGVGVAFEVEGWKGVRILCLRHGHGKNLDSNPCMLLHLRGLGWGRCVGLDRLGYICAPSGACALGVTFLLPLGLGRGSGWGLEKDYGMGWDGTSFHTIPLPRVRRCVLGVRVVLLLHCLLRPRNMLLRRARGRCRRRHLQPLKVRAYASPL